MPVQLCQFFNCRIRCTGPNWALKKFCKKLWVRSKIFTMVTLKHQERQFSINLQQRINIFLLTTAISKNKNSNTPQFIKSFASCLKFILKVSKILCLIGIRNYRKMWCNGPIIFQCIEDMLRLGRDRDVRWSFTCGDWV